MKAALLTAIVASLASSSASAAVLQANPANLQKVFSSAKSGDTIQLTGTFGATWLSNRSFTSPVILDATKAVFTNTLTVTDVTGLNIVRGTFGSQTQSMRALRSVIVLRGKNINLQGNNFIGNGVAAGSAANHGLLVRDSKNVNVTGSNFGNLHTGLGVISSSNVKIANSRFTAMTSDGINIANSHFVTASANRCEGTTPFAGAHPDCIQLWSLKGQPVQSDISLLNNIAIGATQGFASFNGADGGGLRISMIGNYVATSFPQGIACYNCNDSIFRDNILNTLPGAQYQTRMNIFGTNNIVANNVIGRQGALVIPLSESMMSDVAAIPEPSEWMLFIVGFGFVGSFSRRRKQTLMPQSA